MKTKLTLQDYKEIHKEAKEFRIKKIEETVQKMKEGKPVSQIDIDIIKVWGNLYGRED